MVLGMARPWKHPKTGVYWMRLRVPERLRPAVGKREVKKTLGTKDPSVARERHAIALRTVREQWANLAMGTKSLSQREAQAYAGEIYRAMITGREDNPGAAWVFRTRIAQFTAQRARADRGDEWAKLSLMEPVLDEVEAFLAERGLVLDANSLERLADATRDAFVQAQETILKRAEGDYRPDPNADRFPALSDKGVGHEALFAEYKKARNLSNGSIKRWKPILEKMVAFVGTTDLSRFTEERLCEWRDHLLESGLAPRTVRESYIAAEWPVTPRRYTIPIGPSDTV